MMKVTKYVIKHYDRDEFIGKSLLMCPMRDAIFYDDVIYARHAKEACHERHLLRIQEVHVELGKAIEE